MRSKFPHSTCDLAPGEVRAPENVDFDCSGSSPHLFAATLASSCLLATRLSTLSPAPHSPGLRSLSLPSWCFSTTPLLRLGFGTRDGRGSGMRYFRALAYVPTPHGWGWKRLDRPAPSRPRHSGLRTAGPLRPPRLGSHRVAIRGVSSGRARAPLRFPKQPPGGERRERGSFFCGTQYVPEGFLSKKWVFGRPLEFKVSSINAMQGGISCHPP